MRSRSTLALLALIVAALAMTAGCAPPSGSPAEGEDEPVQAQVDPWEAIFDRLDQAGPSIWSASAKVSRFYPYHENGYLRIFAANARQALTREELTSIGADERPYTVIILKFENHTQDKIWVFGSSPDSFTLVDNRGRSYEPFDPLDKDVLAKVPYLLLKRSPHSCFDDIVPEARTYMVLVFPEIKEGIKLLYISDVTSARYEATLRFNK